MYTITSPNALIALAWWLVFPSLAIAQDIDHSKTGFVNAAGVELFYECTGTGSSTIVIEQGLGVVSTGEFATRLWSPFVKEFARSHRVCWYDRAGIGKSNRSQIAKHSSEDIADRLFQLVQKINNDEPVILVGHSVASLHIRMFHHKYPNHVAAALLIEGTPYGSELWAYNELQVPHPADNPDYLAFRTQFLKRFTDPGTNPEKLDILASNEQVDQSNTFQSKPLAIVQRTFQYTPPPKGLPKDVEHRWNEIYAQSEQVFLKMSTNSRFWRSTSVSHFLQSKEEDFETVKTAMEWLIRQTVN